MFQVNDVIIYGTQGVCRITGMEEKNISGSKKTYYVLQPVDDRGPTVFAPTDNAHVLKKMRRLLTRQEICELIDTMPEEDAVWVQNENERKERYRSILAGGDHRELIRMLKAIYAHRQEREAEGKQLHLSDDRFFRDAEDILYNEFQYVLGLQNKSELLDYIIARLDHKSK